MIIKVLHLYHDLMNLYGEYGNIAVLCRYLEDAGIEVQLDKVSVDDSFNITDYNFVYCGAGTERNQKVALADLISLTAPQYTKGFTDQLHTLDIPYIYIDSNIKDVPPLAFFGQNSRQSGYFAARMLMLLARDEKEIVIFRKIHEGIVGSNQQENREIGFRQYMEEYHPSCTILELDLHAERNDEDNEMLDEFFRTYPTVKNGITFNSKAYIVGEYLQSRGKKDFNLIGYDLLERNVTCLKEGSISFLIAQQPELQGANGIKALCDHLIFKKEVTCINYMPIDLLTVETIDYYHSK